MPRVICTGSFAGNGKRLARTRSAPHWPVISPACHSQGEAPSPNSCEQMHLCVSPQVLSSHILNAPLVHVARRDMPRRDQVAQPLGGIGVELVVVSCQPSPPSFLCPPAGHPLPHTLTPQDITVKHFFARHRYFFHKGIARKCLRSGKHCPGYTPAPGKTGAIAKPATATPNSRSSPGVVPE